MPRVFVMDILCIDVHSVPGTHIFQRAIRIVEEYSYERAARAPSSRLTMTSAMTIDDRTSLRAPR